MEQPLLRVTTAHPDKTAVKEETKSVEMSAPKLSIRDLSVFYGDFRAITNINVDIQTNKITAIIGPSGCGKSTLLRSLNRMNDLTPGARVDGEILLDGKISTYPV